MFNRVFKQILWAIAFLALAFFIIDLTKIYIEFTPDRFKLSIAQLSSSLLVLLTKALLKSVILMSPLLAVSIVLSFSKSMNVSNFNIRSNSVLFVLLSSISVTFYFFETIFQKLKIKEILSKNLFDGINVKYLLCTVFIYSILVTLVIFKKNKSKRIFKNQKRSFSALLISFTLIILGYFEFSYFHILKGHKSSVLSYVKQMKNFNTVEKTKEIINYKSEFKKYLGLNDIYENEKNYLNLLKRKTSFKPQEMSVVLIYVDSLSMNDLVDNTNSKLVTFNRVLSNYSESMKSLRYIKMDIPPVVDIDTALDINSIKTYYSNVFKNYEIIEKNSLVDLQESLHFTILYLKSLTPADYIVLNKMIEKYSDNTVFVFTSNSNSFDKPTFISFHLPNKMNINTVKTNKIIGQEDIMTTIYNLALSEKEYLSLGDDIFIDSNSNAINERVCIDETGKYLFSKRYQKVQNKSSLVIRCTSTKHIANFILEQSFTKDEY